MPLWIKPDFQRAVYVDSFTVSITFLEYLGILPCIERYSKNSPGKDATVFSARVLLRLSYNFVWISGRKSPQVLVQVKNCFFWRMGMFLSYLNN